MNKLDIRIISSIFINNKKPALQRISFDLNHKSDCVDY